MNRCKHPGAVVYIYMEGSEYRVKRLDRASVAVSRERWEKLRLILRSFLFRN